jgi:PII-like signaling protein
MSWTTRPSTRLTVLIDDTDTWHHRPMSSEIVHRAHAAGLSGASVFRGVEGFGCRQVVHTTRLLSMSDDLPLAVVIVDSDEQIRGFLPQLEELDIEGLITLEHVETVGFVPEERTPSQ